MQDIDAIKKEEKRKLSELKTKDSDKLKKEKEYKGAYIDQEEHVYQYRGLWVPRELWEDKELGWTEKRMMIEIMNRSIDNKMVCTTQFLADIMDLKHITAHKTLMSLLSKEYLQVVHIRKTGGRDKARRYLRINKYKYLD